MSLPPVFVLDTETTGLCGYPRDRVVDIAICKVNFDTAKIEEVYSSVVGHDVDKWDIDQKNAWIFQNTDLKLEDVKNAPPLEEIASDVQDILKGNVVTSYNVGFDFRKFLNYNPWKLGLHSHIGPCIMLAATDICKIPGYGEDYKWPKLQEAYDLITVDDPVGIKGRQTHRALSDAVMASWILLELAAMGVWIHPKEVE